MRNAADAAPTAVATAKPRVDIATIMVLRRERNSDGGGPADACAMRSRAGLLTSRKPCEAVIPSSDIESAEKNPEI